MIGIDLVEVVSIAPIIIAIIATLTLFITIIGWFIKRKRIQKKYYKVNWQNSSKLKPEELMGLRPLNDFFFRREKDNIIVENLNKGKNILIIGRPLAGKTRSLCEALVKNEKKYNIIVPRCVDIDLENHFIPRCFLINRTKLMILDDLHKFVERQNVDHLIRSAIESNIQIVATCQISRELSKVKKILLDKGIHLDLIFKDPPVNLPKIKRNEAKKIAQIANKKWDKVKFNGTIGSIFMKLSELEKRYIHESNFDEKNLLMAIKKLNIAGLYVEGDSYFVSHLEKLIEHNGKSTDKYDLKRNIKSLYDKNLIEKINKETVQVEEVYLNDIVKFDASLSKIDVLNELLNVFNGNPKVVNRIGSIALNNSKKHNDIIAYLDLSRTAYTQVLGKWTKEKNPGGYAMVHNSLGIVYADLGSLKSPTFFKPAINSFNESLKITGARNNPDYYNLTLLNLAYAYSGLAEVEEKESNKQRAIQFYNECLKHFTKEKFPYEYATVMHNLSATYCAIANIKDLNANCKKAIQACENALKVRTKDEFPYEYAATHHNLALAYYYLAKEEKTDRKKRIEHCEEAIKACEIALKQRNPRKFPIQFAATQGLLGSIYGRLIPLFELHEERKKCGELAINAFEKIIKVLKKSKFQITLARQQKSLGVVYLNLAYYVEKKDNCEKAIYYFEKSLLVFTGQDFPVLHSEVSTNLLQARRLCGGL